MARATIVRKRSSHFPRPNVYYWQIPGGESVFISHDSPILNPNLLPSGAVRISSGQYAGKLLDLRTGEIY